MIEAASLPATDPYARRRRWLAPLLGIGLLGAAWAALALGAVSVSAREVAAVLAERVGLDLGDPSSQATGVVWGIRLPRLLLGLSVGGGLGIVGAMLQGLLRNELADPQLLGIGPGAAIGAAIGSSLAGVQGAIAGGVAAGVATAFAVRRLAQRASIDPTRIVLSGIALGAALSAWVGFVVFAADRATVPPVEFWLLGSLTGATWRAVGTAAGFLLMGAAVMLGSWRLLDLMSLGEANARHLGVDVDLVRTVLLLAAGATVGATVGAVGVVGFVGLLVPFLVRRLSGPSHRYLLPAAVGGGALFVVLADLVARLAIEPVEIPVGLVTAAAGGPVFLWLVSGRRDV